jgi:hypothetical protein
VWRLRETSPGSNQDNYNKYDDGHGDSDNDSRRPPTAGRRSSATRRGTLFAKTSNKLRPKVGLLGAGIDPAATAAVLTTKASVCANVRLDGRPTTMSVCRCGKSAGIVAGDAAVPSRPRARGGQTHVRLGRLSQA